MLQVWQDGLMEYYWGCEGVREGLLEKTTIIFLYEFKVIIISEDSYICPVYDNEIKQLS